MPRSIRIVSTHDFFGSFAVLPTSYGTLAGGEGLRLTVDRLRKGGASVWLDSGDFSQGGPLTLETGGLGGNRAVSELGIDAAVVGNHELDFGVEHLGDGSGAFGFPVLCANLDLGFPATAVLSTPEGDVGVIGLTHPNLNSMRSWSMRPERAMPLQEGVAPFDVAGAAADLRKQGAAAVAVLIHDGVDWGFDRNGRYVVQEERFIELCRPWHAAVDVIVAGHTLGRFMGHVGNTPVLQPWPLGTEVGVVDVDLNGKVGRSEPQGVTVEPHGQWGGFGSDIIAAAEQDVLGRLGAALEARSRADAPLAVFLAQAVHKAAEADVALAYTTCGQPTIDGVIAYLPPGPVTRLQLLQMVPFSDLSIVVAEIDAAELDRIRLLTDPNLQDRTTAWGQFGEPPHRQEHLTIATTGGAAADVIANLVERDLTWLDTGHHLPNAVRKLLNGQMRHGRSG